MTERRALDALLRRDFPSFCQRSFLELEGADLVLSRYLMALTWTMMRVAMGDAKRLVINMPPRHLKSQVVSVFWVAWMLMRDPSRSFCILSYDEKLAQALAGSLKRLITSAWYQALAPAVRIQTGDDRARDFRTTAGGQVYACSIRTGITGHGFDFIILDDPQSAHDAASEADRKWLHHAFEGAIATRLDDQQTGVIIIVQQRLHEDDLSGHVLQRPGWEHFCMPLVASEERSYAIAPGDEWHRPVGDVTRPDQFTPAGIIQLTARIGLSAFSAQFQQMPGAEAGAIISRDQIGHVDYLPPAAMTHYIVVDTAVKTNENSSYTAILHIATDGKRHYILKAFRGRYTVIEMVGIIERILPQARIHRIIIEESANGPALEEFLKYKGIRCEPKGVGRESKEERLQKYIYLFIDQLIYVVGREPWVAVFLDELLRFPMGRFDDQVDALTLYLAFISTNRVHAPVLAGQLRHSIGFEGDRPPPRGDHILRPRSGPRGGRRWR